MTPQEETFWNAIDACVATLPHKVEWLNQGSTKIVSEIHNTFVIPLNLIDAFGGSQKLFDGCKQIAERYKCTSFFKANNGSFVFKKY